MAHLEFVSRPESPIVQVAAWLTFLYKLARIENPIIGLKPEVTIRLPAHLCARTMSDEARVAFSCGNNQKSRDGIHAVVQALPPLKYPIRGGGHIVRQRRFNLRVYVHKVDGTGTCGGKDSKIVA